MDSTPRADKTATSAEERAIASYHFQKRGTVANARSKRRGSGKRRHKRKNSAPEDGDVHVVSLLSASRAI
jgi:hypothetical protein